MTKEEQIQKSKENSIKNYKAKREKVRAKQRMLKEGRIKVVEKEIPVYKINVGNGFKLAIGIIQVNSSMIYFTWAACSPKDNWSNRIAKGLIGSRLDNGGCFCLLEYDKSVVQLAYNYIIDRAKYGTEFEQSTLPAMSKRFIKSLQGNTYQYAPDIIFIG